MPSQKNMLRLRLAACLLMLCLAADAQPGDPNKGRRPAPRVPLTGIGWLIAAGALVGGLALRRCGDRNFPGRPNVKSFLGILVVAYFATHEACAQERITVRDGNWETPSTWADGIVPSPDNSTTVKVQHTVTIAAGSDVSIDNLIVEGRLVVLADGVLEITNGDSTDLQLTEHARLDVWGRLIAHDGISLDGLNASNTTFHENSVYDHHASDEGSIPVAQWHPQARFEITGINGNVSMRSNAWGQAWGTIVYNCAEQGQFVDFRGRLETIQGDFIIASTNNSILRLAQSQAIRLTVGGDVIISGPSEVWFSQSDSCTVDVQGDLVFASTSGASSYFTTTGVAHVTIGGNLVVNAQHRLRMASGSGTGRTELTVRGDVTFSRGRLDAAGTGSGSVIFGGSEIQHVHIERSPDTGFEGHIDFKIATGADVDLGTSLLSNTNGGDLIVEGTLRLGSLNGTGAIQAGTEGNIQVADSIEFRPGSRLVYNGSGTQYLSYGQLETQVDVLSPGAIVLGDLQFGGLNAGSSDFNPGGYTLSVRRDLYASGSLSFNMLVMNGSGEQRIGIPNATVHDLIVRQASPGSIVLEEPLQLAGILSIESSGTQVIANGNLTLLSSSESPGGMAAIAKLPAGAAVVGDVVVQRFIAGGPGDHYRYISSPVSGATVADVMDDIPVTGTFEDADYGGELPKDAPSLFYYSEEISDWVPFPVTGTSHENSFASGRGYCLFNWNGEADTNWDVTGTVHQGSLSLPLTYTTSGDTAMRGWNLVGNPYPSTIRWGPEGWNSAHVSASIAVRDNLVGGFRYWDGEVGSLYDGLLATGQSFWVRTTGAGAYLEITEDAKTTLGAEYYRKRPPDFVTLVLTTGELVDCAYLRIRDGASRELDLYDAPKMWNDSLSLAFRTDDGVPTAIHAAPELDSGERIPLEIRDATGQNLAFRVQGHGALQPASFALVDDATGARYDFDEQGEVVLEETKARRLYLVVTRLDSTMPSHTDSVSNPLILGADSDGRLETERERIVVYPVPAQKTVFLCGAAAAVCDDVQIYSAEGRLVYQVSATRGKAGCLEVDVSELPTGYYYVVLPGKKIPSRIRVVKTH